MGAGRDTSITGVPPYRAIAIKSGGVAVVIHLAWQGCMLFLACPFFLHADAVGPKGLLVRRPPLRQVVQHLKNALVAISDPAGETVRPIVVGSPPTALTG